MKRWSTAAIVAVPPQITGDERKFHWLRLGLLINAHCAEAFDDDTVSEHLNQVWETQRFDLPFRVPNEN